MSSPLPQHAFSVEYRDRVRSSILANARSDDRVISGAALGSDAAGETDRWSDIDLTFGLKDGTPLERVLDDWTKYLERDFSAVPLFDIADRATVYRVFLFPGNLQVDLSFTRGFAAQYGPRFRLLFGTALKREPAEGTPPEHIFGLGVHHAVRARYCIERGRYWQAEYWISGVRDHALWLACHRRGLEPYHGRGYDRLPRDVLALAAEGLVRSLDRRELGRALSRVTSLLVQEGSEVDLAQRVVGPLRELGEDAWV